MASNLAITAVVFPVPTGALQMVILLSLSISTHDEKNDERSLLRSESSFWDFKESTYFCKADNRSEARKRGGLISPGCSLEARAASP